MSILATLSLLAQRGAAYLEELYHAVSTADTTVIAEWAHALDTHPADLNRHYACARRLRKEDGILELMREHKFSLRRILLIDKRCRQLNDHALRSDYLRHFTEFAVSEQPSLPDLDAYLTDAVSRANATTPPPQHPRARVSKRADVRGFKHLHISAPAAHIDNLVAPLTPHVNGLKLANPSHSRDRCLGHAIVDAISGGGPLPSDDATDQLRHQPALIITAQDILDYSPRFAATSNGSTLTPAEFTEALLADTGWVLYYDAANRPAELHRIRNERLADQPQRVAMLLDNPVCAWPGCTAPAQACQAHHLEAHKHGGPTQIDNLAMVCPYHNRINDDDRIRGSGHLERDPQGHVRLVNPGTIYKAPIYNQAFVTACAGRAYAAYRQPA